MVTEEKAVGLITFSGKESDWHNWKFVSLSKATCGEYRDILEGNNKVAVPKHNVVLGDELKTLGITIEYVAPNTPQQNGVVERAIATCIAKT